MECDRLTELLQRITNKGPLDRGKGNRYFSASLKFYGYDVNFSRNSYGILMINVQGSTVSSPILLHLTFVGQTNKTKDAKNHRN